MSAASPVYLEIIDFIAAGTTPETVTHFQSSIEAQQRVAELIAGRKISPFHLRMAKARARQILTRGH